MRMTGVSARALAASAAVIGLLVAGSPARAGDPVPPLPLPSASPTPSPSPTPTRSTKPKPRPKPKTPAKPQAAQPKGPAPSVYNGPVADALAYWRSLPKTPSRTTTTLLSLLQRLQPPGVPLDRGAIVRGVWRFPIAGYTWYQDDWAAPRYLPYFHMHEGNDLFAADGTPVVACANGVIEKMMVGTIGGVSIWLKEDNGTVFYYGHLRDYAPNLKQGQRVKIGQTIGFVGNSGTALTTSPHVHFEIHPGGGLPVNPKPIVDGWLAEAEARAQAAIRRSEAATSAARIGAARWKRLLGLLAQPGANESGAWTVSMDATRYVDLAVERIALEVDWTAVGRQTAADLEAGAGLKSPANPVTDDHGILAGVAHQESHE